MEFTGITLVLEFLLDKTQPVVSYDDVRGFRGVVEHDKVYQVYWAGDARTKRSFYDAKVLYMAVSVAFFGSAAAETCRNGTRPASQTAREGCDYYCWNTVTSSWDKYFFGDEEPCFYNTGLQGTCKNGACHLTNQGGVTTDPDQYPSEPTEKPKKNKKKSKKTKKPKKSKKSKDN